MDYHLLFFVGPALLLLGAVVGLLSGLLGLGGGIVLVPALFYGLSALGYSSESNMMHMAIGTSLAVIIPTGLSSARSHWKRGSVRMDLLKDIGVGVVVGVFIGTLVAGSMDGHQLRVIFSVVLIFLAAVINIDARHFTLVKNGPSQPWSGMIGIVLGAVSTLMGIGGATISVPYMLISKIPMQQAVGTASALTVVIAIPAMIGFLLIGSGQENLPPFSLGYINVLAWALIVPTSILVAPWGVHLAHKIPVKNLRYIFAVLLCGVAVKMLYGVFYE